jgi:hypothetical protein
MSGSRASAVLQALRFTSRKPSPLYDSGSLYAADDQPVRALWARLLILGISSDSRVTTQRILRLLPQEYTS